MASPNRHSQTEVSTECPLNAGIVTSAPTNSSPQRHKMADTERTDTVESSAPAPVCAEPAAVVLEPYMRRMFEWSVERCSRLVSASEGAEAKKNYFLRSPLFRFMHRTWYMQLYPNRQTAIRLCLFLFEGRTPAMVKQSFGIRTVSGNIEWKTHKTCRFDTVDGRKISRRTGQIFITKVELANRMPELAKDDVLTIVCNLFSEECINFLEGFMYKREESIPRRLLPESRPWDLTFYVEDRILVVDSAILRLHCPNLASQVEPGKTYHVHYHPWVYRQFLLYLYIGKVVNMKMEEVILLYGLAKWYQVSALLERCLCLMTAFMDPDNVVLLLVFAESRTEPDLAAVAKKFLLGHTMQVISSPVWIEYIKEKPDEANQLYILIAENYKNAIHTAKIHAPSGSTETASISH